VLANQRIHEGSGLRQSGDQWRWWGVYSFVVKRESFTRVRSFVIDLKNGEDCDLALRLGTETGFVQVTSSITFSMRESITLGAAAVIKPKYEGSNQHEAIPIPRTRLASRLYVDGRSAIRRMDLSLLAAQMARVVDLPPKISTDSK
jgi:hypothetical protein